MVYMALNFRSHDVAVQFNFLKLTVDVFIEMRIKARLLKDPKGRQNKIGHKALLQASCSQSGYPVLKALVKAVTNQA